MTGCLLNVALDPVFIMPWGLGMGAAGAGLATFISNCVACAYFFVLLAVKRGRTYVCVDPRKLRFERRIVASVCGVGIPAAIQNLLNVTGMTILNNLVHPYGADAIAAMGICQKLVQVALYATLGFSQGVMPLVSYNYSSGNIKRMKGGVRIALIVCLSFMLFVTALFIAFPAAFVRLFMHDEDVVAYGSRFLWGLYWRSRSVHGLHGRRRVPGRRPGAQQPYLRRHAQDSARDPGAAHTQRHLPPLRPGLRPVAAELVLAAAAAVVLRRLFRRPGGRRAADGRGPARRIKCRAADEYLLTKARRDVKLARLWTAQGMNTARRFASYMRQ